MLLDARRSASSVAARKHEEVPERFWYWQANFGGSSYYLRQKSRAAIVVLPDLAIYSTLIEAPTNGIVKVS